MSKIDDIKSRWNEAKRNETFSAGKGAIANETLNHWLNIYKGLCKEAIDECESLIKKEKGKMKCTSLLYY